MTSFDVRTANLKAINSLTKYPSIPTYHKLDPSNGNLLDEVVDFGNETVIATEKIDGTNGRIVFLPDGTYLIGSREHLLYAKGDLIGDQAQGIVEALKPVAERVDPVCGLPIQVLYLEVYGGKIGAAKQYTRAGRVGVRLFDSAIIGDLDERLSWPSERIASWRDNGGQTFIDEDYLEAAAGVLGVELAPRLTEEPYESLPASIDDMHKLLQELVPQSWAPLDFTGNAEGVVFRTYDRSVIAKARFQDYGRTMKRRGGAR